MQLVSLVLGIGTLLLFSASLGAYAMILDPTTAYGLAASGLLFAAGWAFLNRQLLGYVLLRKSTRRGANVAFVTFLVFGIVVCLNMLGREFSWRKDLTRSGANSLSPQTLKILGSLTQDVKVLYFNAGQQKDMKEPIFKSFGRESKHFLYEFVDSARRPTLVQTLGVKRNDTTVLELAGTNKRVKVDGSTEEKLTNGLIKLLRSAEQTVYFTSGHGERSLVSGGGDGLTYGLLKEELEKQGYSVKELSLLTEGKVPADAAALVVGGPQRAFFPKEVEILRAWMHSGGRAIFALDVDPAESGLGRGSRAMAELLKGFGVIVHSEMLVDPASRSAQVEPQILLAFNATKDHPISAEFPISNNAAAFYFPLTTRITSEEVADMRFTELARSSPNAWAESNWASLKSGAVSFQPKEDTKGPMTIALAAEEVAPPAAEGEPAKPAKKTLRFVVFGTSTFVTDTVIDKVLNRDLFLNSVAWLVGDDSLISIRAKESDAGLRNLNDNALTLIFAFAWVGLPIVLLLFAGYVWWRRSRL